TMVLSRLRVALILLVALLDLGVAPFPAIAQDETSVGGRSEIFVGTDLERYLRLLQIDGRATLYPWGIRGFSPIEIDTILSVDRPHPWEHRYDLGRWRPSHGVRLDVIAPTLVTRFNSSFPFGSNDGPVWAGRGL